MNINNLLSGLSAGVCVATVEHITGDWRVSVAIGFGLWSIRLMFKDSRHA